MVALGGEHGVRTCALLTGMDTPLGRAVGNAVEVEESVATLRGDGPGGSGRGDAGAGRADAAAGGRGRRPGRGAGRRPGAGQVPGHGRGAGRRSGRAAAARRARRGGDRAAGRLDAAGWTRGRSAWPPGGSARAGPARRIRSTRPPESCAWPSPVTRWSDGQPILELRGNDDDRIAGALRALEGAVEIGPRAARGAAAHPGAHRPLTAAPPHNGRVPSIEEIRAAPKALLHDHLDGGLRPATVVELAREIGYDKLPSDDPDEVAAWLTRGARRGHLKYYLDAFQHTVAVMQTREALIRVAAECAEDLGRRRGGLRRGQVRPRTARGRRPEPRPGGRGGARGLQARQQRPGNHRVCPAHRHAHGGALAGDRRARGALPGRGGGGVRHRGRRGGQPAEPAPGRLPVRGAGELPHHHPCRRGVRPALHLGGAAVVRGRAARARGQDRRRHPGLHRRHRVAGPAGQLYPRSPHPARDVPDVQRADRGRAVDRGAPDRPAPAALVPGDGEHRQPADERGVPVVGVPRARPRRSATAGRTSSGSRSTR